ncbi:MAG: hypothetical protein R6V55_16580, partial [Desulfovermiculus sp.]
AYEGYYCSVFYCYFAALGLDIRPEEVTSHGHRHGCAFCRTGLYLRVQGQGSGSNSGKALAQLQVKGYAE